VILYGDTSSLVKLYVVEADSAEIRAKVNRASAVASSTVAYVELRATLSRARRERRLTPLAYRAARDQFEVDWSAMVAIELSGAIRSAAADLVERHALRALDAIHLASFVHLLQSTTDDVEFSSFDDRLTRAARRLR
jgi:predicted nucleic acid-binding protein